ncbi:MAG TPA: TolC family protein [Bacteroidales bacterium]|nr:TolC family protein [Bacteroidales bacterium]
MKPILKFLITNLLTCFLFFTCINAQVIHGYDTKPVSLSGFLRGVLKGNLGYIAEQFNVDIAKAEMKASRVFPDPEMSVIYANNEDRKLQMGQSVEAGISYPVNAGNKRKAGINLARSQFELSELILESYFRNLLADAALSYFAGIRDREIYTLRVNMLKQVQELAQADSLRNVAGEISNLDALQSSLEARSFKSTVYESYAEMKNTFANLMILQGKKLTDTLDLPSDTFNITRHDFNLSDLLDSAVLKRSDLMAAIKKQEISEKNLNLLKAERSFEFSIEAGYSYNSIVRNEIAPAPAFNGISAGISVPMKFSNINRGQVKAAEMAISQNAVLSRESELEIRTEVVRAFNKYTAQRQKVGHFNLGLIGDAQRILTGKIFSYQKGETNLIEVINAQRTYIDLQLDYIDALFEFTASLIELERAAGIWDIL